MGGLARVVVGGIVAAVVAAALGLLLVTSDSTHRAYARMAVLPSAAVPPDQVPSFWEALGQGQVPRTAAEVFGSDQWVDEAAQAAGVAPSSLDLSAGIVPGTSLVEVTLEADSAPAAERGLSAAVDSALPLATLASGPYAMAPVSGPEGTAEPVGASAMQVVPLMAVAGFLVGAGTALLIIRRHLLRTWLQRGGLEDSVPATGRDGPLKAAPSRDPRPTPGPRLPIDDTTSSATQPGARQVPLHRRAGGPANGSANTRVGMQDAPTTSLPAREAPRPRDEGT